MSSLARSVSADSPSGWHPVVELLQSFDCPRCGSRGAWLPAGRLSTRLNSCTGVARCRLCGHRVFVKRIRRYPQFDPAARARREFSNAELLYRAVPGDDETGIARPLAAIGDVIVFDYISGKPLSMALWFGGRERRCALLGRIGAWFARLHASSEVDDRGDAGLAVKLGYLRERCREASARHASVARALELQQRRLESLVQRNLPLVLVHGDAKAANFLFTNGRIVAIDVDYRLRNLAEMDLAQFLVQLRWSSGLLGVWRGLDRRPTEAAFLEGYASVRPFDAEALAWMETYFTLSLWMSARRASTLRRFHADLVFAPQLQRILDESQLRESTNSVL